MNILALLLAAFTIPQCCKIDAQNIRCVARAWEAANSLPSLFGGAGMGAQRAAWQAAFMAECAALDGHEHVQALLDLVEGLEKAEGHLRKLKKQ